MLKSSFANISLKNDVPAGLVVFLVALPLCLGVALASGAPLMSGIISGIIGGIVVGTFSHSHTSVSGPAAGLTAIVLSSIQLLGGFEMFLTALLLAGFLQLIMGLLKIGFIANYIPSNVIKGLLAAIGILLILKQIPHAIGYDAVPFNDAFSQSDRTFSLLAEVFEYVSPGALIISIISIPILIYWEKIPLKQLKYFPASLFVVILGIALGALFTLAGPLLAIDPSHLVNLPSIHGEDLARYIHLPSLSDFRDVRIYTVALTLAAVASLETLLNIEALDKIDPLKRETPPNSELTAQGIGNIFAGLLGGIPLTSVIVRSSVNIGAGNRSKLSAILHGVLILVSILALVPVMNLIPLASLAAILLVTGYKLAKISLFKEMYGRGLHQFIPFAATIVAIVLTDLLIGILIGLGISIFFLLRSNFRNPFTLMKDNLAIGEVIKIDLSDEVSFLNKASIKEILWHIPKGSKVVIDASSSSFIDDDVLELIQDYKTTVAPNRDIQLNVLGLKDVYQQQDHIQFINVLDKASQENLTPDGVLKLLQDGNARFVNQELREKYYHHQVDATSDAQSPMAVVLSCIDSRTSPEIVFDAGIGDLLIIRVAGNICSEVITGSIELAVMKVGAKLVVVLGHSNCGAVQAAIQGTHTGSIAAITSKIDKSIARYRSHHGGVDIDSAPSTRQITCMNAENTIAEIVASSTYLAKCAQENEIRFVPAYYDTTSGKVDFGFVSSEHERQLQHRD